MTKPLPPAGPLPPLEEPQGALIVRDANGKASITPAGLEYIAYLASEGCSQTFIANKLGIGSATFKKLLGKAADDPISKERDAYEGGRAKMKTEILRYQLNVMRKGDRIMPMFLGKAILGQREAGASTEVTIDNRSIFFKGFADSGVIMDGSNSIEKYIAEHGGIVDARDPKAKAAYDAALEYARTGKRENVVDEPAPMKVISPPTPEPKRVALTPQNGQAIGPNFNRTQSF